MVITSDNPRTEDPLRILADVEPGVRSAGHDVAGGPATGARAISSSPTDPRRSRSRSGSRPGDSWWWPKGHEDYQIIGTEKRHLDDREEVRRALSTGNERVERSDWEPHALLA